MTSIFLWLQRYAIFRGLWHILKNYWWVILIIAFWPVIDKFMAMRFPMWLDVKLRAQSFWTGIMSISPFFEIRAFILNAWEAIRGAFQSGGEMAEVF